MVSIKSALLGLPLLLAGLAMASYPDPNSCSGTCTNAHDPSVIRRDDGTYFRFSTGGEEIAIHTAADITGPWTYVGAAIPDGSIIDIDGNTDLWVSTVHSKRISGDR